jgi:hypothetical protein
MDEIVAAIPHRDYVLLVTCRGRIFKLVINPLTDEPTIQILVKDLKDSLWWT